MNRRSKSIDESGLERVENSQVRGFCEEVAKMDLAAQGASFALLNGLLET